MYSDRALSRTAMSHHRHGRQSQPPRVDAMRSWPTPSVPELPGAGAQLRLYDSADRQVRPVSAGELATMYVCGITPYDATHLGHAATYLTFDLVAARCGRIVPLSAVIRFSGVTISC